MNSTLIIVEGPSDKGFIEGIAEKLQVACQVHFPGRPGGNRPEKVKRLLKTYIGKINKAIVLKDLHKEGRDTTKLINELRSGLRQVESEGLQAHLIVVKRSIESWILAGLCVNNPEEILNPIEELRKIMEEKGKHYIKSPEIYKRLATKEVDITKAATKCQAFKNFIELLRIYRG